MPNLVILSGLPASGKTSLGKEIAEKLGYSFLDKDDYLETLLNQYRHYDQALRQKLSRQSDLQLQDETQKSGNSVICSFWRPRNLEVSYGTPTDWIDLICERPFEVYCNCDVDTAVNRFLKRIRHPGHLDNLRSKEDLTKQFYDLPAGLVPALVEI